MDNKSGESILICTIMLNLSSLNMSIFFPLGTNEKPRLLNQISDCRLTKQYCITNILMSILFNNNDLVMIKTSMLTPI